MQKTAMRRLLVGSSFVAVFLLGTLFGQGKLGFSFAPYGDQTGLPKRLDYSQVDEVYQALRTNYYEKLTTQQVLDGMKHGLAQSTGDPYTEFFTADEANQFNNDLQGTITGVGAQLQLDADGNIVIIAPLAGSPAEAAGLRAKDVIIAIDGKTTSGMTATEAVLKIRGEKGTKVTLTVVRDGKEQLEFTIVRDTIHVPSVESKILDGNIGYMQVSQFSDDTDELARKAAQEFQDKGIKKVVLDLRDNPGGEVASAVGLCSLWLDKGQVVVQEKRGDALLQIDRATGDPLLKGMQTVVLINAGSASASEITALALRDQIKAELIGEKSFGKGVMQQLIPFGDGSSLKVTIGKWYSPKGANINGKGIEPDQTVALTAEDAKAKNDTQLDAATVWLSKQ
ncbi:S41 family peptidase [Candidatus Saccharibacteria bacterium]|nr:S41 family peptidase [Candidatus Saccharibacteria bacterium]